MNNLRLAISMSALTLAWVISAPIAYAVGHPEQSTTEQVVKSQSDEQPLSTQNNGAAGEKQQAPSRNKGATKTAPAKHPPTAVMDRAAPDQKSPGTASNDSVETSPPAK